MYKYDKNKIKENLTIEEVFSLVNELGGEPIMDRSNRFFTSITVCHGGDSHKLYYYDNTKLFRCYTGCGDTSFDIFELVKKVKQRLENPDYELYQAIQFVAQFFNLSNEIENFSSPQANNPDWNILNKYEQIQSKEIIKNPTVEFKKINEQFLKNLPHPRIIPWEEEGISEQVMKNKGIGFEPASQSIMIPHYDIDGNLIGLRGRTLIKEDEIYGKYKPLFMYINGEFTLFNHPLGFNLYNLNNSKENIKRVRKVVVLEGEKSCLKYASYFGEENDISCAVCGSNITSVQINLLLSLDIDEIIIAFDKQFKELGDEEHKTWVKKLEEINKKYSPYCQISFLFDKWDLLVYKDSPIDRGVDIFLELFKKRIIL